MGRIKKYQEVQGVITVEMAYLMPIIFMVFVLVVYTSFYYHDKQILIGAAAETVTVGVQQKRWPGESVGAEQFCRERIGEKLILFAETEVTIAVTKEWVDVDIYARKKKMKLHIRQRAPVVNPEKKIRRKAILEKAIKNSESE